MTQKTELDEWIEALYPENNEFTVEYHDRPFKFQKKLPSRLVFMLSDKTPADRMASLLAIASIDPHLTPDQVNRLPMDFTSAIFAQMDFDEEMFKKKV